MSPHLQETTLVRPGQCLNMLSLTLRGARRGRRDATRRSEAIMVSRRRDARRATRDFTMVIVNMLTAKRGIRRVFPHFGAPHFCTLCRKQEHRALVHSGAVPEGRPGPAWMDAPGNWDTWPCSRVGMDSLTWKQFGLALPPNTGVPVGHRDFC